MGHQECEKLLDMNVAGQGVRVKYLLHIVSICNSKDVCEWVCQKLHSEQLCLSYKFYL